MGSCRAVVSTALSEREVVGSILDGQRLSHRRPMSEGSLCLFGNRCQKRAPLYFYEWLFCRSLACLKANGRSGRTGTICRERERERECVCVCQNEKRECQTNGKHYKRKSQAQWKEKYRTGRGPFRQSSHCHPDKRKRERLSTKSTHVTVYLFRDLNRDRSRLLWMTVGPKGQYSAKRRTRNRQSSKTFKR